MKTDVQLCRLFESNPMYLADILKLEHGEDYEAVGEVFKQIERRADLVWKSDKHPDMAAIEIQGYDDDLICHRGELIRVMLSMKDTTRTVRLIFVFLDPSLDPKTEPWATYMKDGNSLYKTVYLNEALAELEARDPDHPLVQVLAPIYMDDSPMKAEIAREKVQKIHASNLSDQHKHELTDLFLSLFTSRFGPKTLEELKFMFTPLLDIKDTGVYKEIFAEGQIEGKAEGQIEGEIKILKEKLADFTEFFEKGLLPSDLYYERRAAIEKILEEKEAALKALATD